MQAASARDGIAERGVYEAPFRVDGHEALLAVDSRGEARKVAKLLPGTSYDRVRASLEAWLDAHDPLPRPPKLELVRDRPAQRRKPRHHMHPAQAASDRHAYLGRLTTQLVQRIRVFDD